MDRLTQSPALHRWVLRRRCALRPAQLLAGVGALLAAHALLGGIAWVLELAWISLFCALAGAGEAVALLAYVRHARDGETVALEDTRHLRVDLHDGERLQAVRLDAAWARVELDPRDTAAPLRLAAAGVEVRVGRHVDVARRQQVAAEIRQALARVRALP